MRSKTAPLWIFLLLFISAPQLSFAQLFEDLKAKSDNLNLQNSPQWHSLLHLYNNKPEIKDPNFFISNNYTDPKTELELTLKALAEHPEQVICRFPARAYWLTTKLNIPEFNYAKCSELTSFTNRAPLDDLSLVFASENITQASSMMGHSLLKISGENYLKIHTEHAITFYTELNDTNFPKLVFESLITGKKGFYTLTPYQTLKNNYLFNEQRNIWEYRLQLSDFEKKLIHLHLFELKNISFNYVFHSFNCSTLDYNILAVIHPEIQAQRDLWVTPLDAVKAINHEAYIKNISLDPSNKWKIRELQKSLYKSPISVTAFAANPDVNLLKNDSSNLEHNFLLLELSSAYNGYKYEKNIILKEEWSKFNEELIALKKNFSHGQRLSLSNFKDPSIRPNDTQFLIGFKQEQHESYLIGFLPASHSLMDDNSQLTNESELKLGETVFNWIPSKKEFSVNSFTAYSSISLQPSDSLISAWSGSFKIAYASSANKKLEFRNGAIIDGSLGKTLRLHNDLDVYFLMHSGYEQVIEELYFKPKIGFIIREILNMKTSVSFSNKMLPKENKSIEEIDFKQAFNMKDYAVHVSLLYFKINNDNATSAELILKKYF